MKRSRRRNSMNVKTALMPWFVACQIAATAGCMSFNENSTEAKKGLEPYEETDSIPIHTEVIAANARLQQRGNSVVVGLALDLKDTYQRKRKNIGSTAQEVVIGSETQTRGVFAKGPYYVEISIPILDDYREERRLSERDSQAVFELPFSEQDRSVDVVISFRADPNALAGSTPALTQSALDLTVGREWIIPISIRGMGRVNLPGHRNGGKKAIPDAVQDAPFEYMDINPSVDGLYTVRVKVKDKSKTGGIGRLIESEAKRQMLKSYMADNPNTSPNYIRIAGELKTEEDGSILIYTGRIFSVRPVEDGWFYDNASRSGWIRLRIPGEMPAQDAKNWARMNISAIVSEKNAVLEAGKAPPPGATYRSLGESFENGVLTVEFEAAE